MTLTEFVKNIQSKKSRKDRLDGSETRVRLISTVPKSGTWAQNYFWSILDSLLANSDSYDPHQHSYQPQALACDVFGVNHSFCPSWRHHIEPPFLQKLEDHLYPGTRGINWFQDHFEKLAAEVDETVDPVSSDKFKIALVYRNPLDQMFSYFRPRWSQKYVDEKGLNWKRFPMPGMLQDKDQIYNIYDTPKETLRAGAANSYCIQLATFVKLQQLAPENVGLFRYEDVCGDRKTHQRALAKFLDLDDGSQHFEDCFERALQLSSKSSLSNLEINKGHRITLPNDQNNTPNDNVHIRWGSDDDWKEVFDQKDVAFVQERLEFFEIPSDVLSI